MPSLVGKTLGNNVNQLLKKSFDLNKLLKEQIKYELQYTNLPFSQKNQFRLIIQNRKEDSHTNVMLLYKRFEDTSLDKTYEMFIKTNVSEILHVDYSVEPQASFKKFKKYVTNYYDKGGSSEPFMAIDDSEYDDLKHESSRDDGIPKDAEEDIRNRIDQLEDLKDEANSMVSFFDEFLTEQQKKNEPAIEDPFEGIFASQFVPLEVIVRDLNNPQHELFIKALLDLTKVKVFIENISVFDGNKEIKSSDNIEIPEWFSNNTDADLRLLRTKHNQGPNFVFYDPKVQDCFYNILKNWGIVENEKFIKDIYEKAEEREQALYLAWLFQLNDFFSATKKK